MSHLALQGLLDRISVASVAAGNKQPRLLAVSKSQDSLAVMYVAAQGQRAFGENYVQEASIKRAAIIRSGATQDLEWHLIGGLQSNKCKQAAKLFDWIHSVDRQQLVSELSKHRPDGLPPLNILIQVNIDDEGSKNGCRPDEVADLADLISRSPRLALRGIMVIPQPHEQIEARRPAFKHAKALFEDMRSKFSQVDTLSMGMSNDFELAIEEGSTMIRVGSALFGPRARR